MCRTLRVCEALLLIGVILYAHAIPLSAQNYGERIEIATMTFPTDKPTALNSRGTAAVIWGYLNLPRGSGERLPAVILAHGCAGVQANTDGWVAELTKMGIATFVLDSFTGRGAKTCTEAGLLSFTSRLVDVYRGLAMLATRPQIDPRRIALMGFSHGAMVALYAAELKFQRAWMPPGDYQFAAYLAFYPGCFVRLEHEELVGDRPIRIYHGKG